MATIIDRRMFAKGFAATAVATGAIALAGCSGEEAPAGSGAASGTSYKIGVLQLTEHSALDAANAGFVKALDDSGITYEIEQQNAQNDQSACQTIAQTLVNDGCDLILAIATPAAQAVAATSFLPLPPLPPRRLRARRATSPSSAPPLPTSRPPILLPTTMHLAATSPVPLT